MAPNSQFVHILQDKSLGLMPNIELLDGVVKANENISKNYDIHLNTKSLNLLKLFNS